MPALLSWIISKRSASNGNKSGRRVRSILHIACRTLWKRIQSGRGPSFLAFHPGKFNFNCFGLDLGRVAELCKSQSSGQFSAVGQCASASGAIGWKYSNHLAALPVGETAIDSNWLPKNPKVATEGRPRADALIFDSRWAYLAWGFIKRPASERHTHTPNISM